MSFMSPSSVFLGCPGSVLGNIFYVFLALRLRRTPLTSQNSNPGLDFFPPISAIRYTVLCRASRASVGREATGSKRRIHRWSVVLRIFHAAGSSAQVKSSSGLPHAHTLIGEGCWVRAATRDNEGGSRRIKASSIPTISQSASSCGRLCEHREPNKTYRS